MSAKHENHVYDFIYKPPLVALTSGKTQETPGDTSEREEESRLTGSLATVLFSIVRSAHSWWSVIMLRVLSQKLSP